MKGTYVAINDTRCTQLPSSGTATDQIPESVYIKNIILLK